MVRGARVRDNIINKYKSKFFSDENKIINNILYLVYNI